MITKETPISELLKFSTPKQLRIMLMKIFFAADSQCVLTQEDKDDVYFLYNFLEEIKEE